MESIEDKIFAIYCGVGKYKLPAVREREAAKLLTLIDKFNEAGIADAEICPFHVKILQLAYCAAHDLNLEWACDLQAQREIDRYLLGESTTENDY